jgi:hypothetical protein
VCTVSIFRLDFRLARSPSLSLEAGGRRIRRRSGVVPAPMVWSIAGGAGGEVWGRLDEAAARELRKRAALATLSAFSRAREAAVIRWRRRVVAGRRCSHGDGADRQCDRANGGLALWVCLPWILVTTGRR